VLCYFDPIFFNARYPINWSGKQTNNSKANILHSLDLIYDRKNTNFYRFIHKWHHDQYFAVFCGDWTKVYQRKWRRACQKMFQNCVMSFMDNSWEKKAKTPSELPCLHMGLKSVSKFSPNNKFTALLLIFTGCPR